MRNDRSRSAAPARSSVGSLAMILALSPAIASIWAFPGFTTQDGPAHLLNAGILVESIPANSPLRQVYAVRWSPLPNWAGHLALMGLSSLFPPMRADRLMTVGTLIGLAAATFWLRIQVAGKSGTVIAGVFSAIVATNVCWLFGFWSFLLGACLFPITLGIWWKLRSKKGLPRAIAIAVLVTLGYFGHLISLALTVLGLIFLEALTPGDRPWRRRLWTLAGFAPLAILGPMYRRMMSQGGAIAPVWGHIHSLRSQLGWVDPITLGQRDSLPFLRFESPWLALFAPATLMAVSCLFLMAVTLPRLPRDRRGWAAISLTLLIGGVFTPDTLGQAHGNYLPQRLILLGLVSLVPWLDLELPRRSPILAVLLVAAILQGLSVCDYAREANARIVPFLNLNASNSLGQNQRVATLLIGIRGRFRSNPLLHADNLLGVGTRHRIWANYETTHYYFPVQFLDSVPRPPAEVFEEVAKLDGPDETAERASIWEKLLALHHNEIDVLLVWGQDPELEAINARWFHPTPIFEEGPLRAYRRDETHAHPPGSRLPIGGAMTTIP